MFLTVDNDDTSFWQVLTSTGACPPCGATASMNVTYTLSVPTAVDSLTLVGATDGQFAPTVVLTSASGSTTTIKPASPPFAATMTIQIPGPWASVVSVDVSFSNGQGGPSGGGGRVRLYETRIKGAGLTRLPRCL